MTHFRSSALAAACAAFFYACELQPHANPFVVADGTVPDEVSAAYARSYAHWRQRFVNDAGEERLTRCAATVLDTGEVLTAAHCTTHGDVGRVSGVTGAVVQRWFALTGEDMALVATPQPLDMGGVEVSAMPIPGSTVWWAGDGETRDAPLTPARYDREANGNVYLTSASQSAVVLPGDSGGPIYDASGRLVAVLDGWTDRPGPERLPTGACIYATAVTRME